MLTSAPFPHPLLQPENSTPSRTPRKFCFLADKRISFKPLIYALKDARIRRKIKSPTCHENKQNTRQTFYCLYVFPSLSDRRFIGFQPRRKLCCDWPDGLSLALLVGKRLAVRPANRVFCFQEKHGTRSYFDPMSVMSALEARRARGNARSYKGAEKV